MLDTILEYHEHIDPVNWYVCFLGVIIYLLMDVRSIRKKRNADPNRTNFSWSHYWGDMWPDYLLSVICSYAGMLIGETFMDAPMTPFIAGMIGTMGTLVWMKAGDLFKGILNRLTGTQGSSNQQSDGTGTGS